MKVLFQLVLGGLVACGASSDGFAGSRYQADRVSGLCNPYVFPRSLRTFDGSGNNLSNPDWGTAHSRLLRMAPADYADGVGEPSHDGRPSPRSISNACSAQPGDVPNRRRASDLVWQWGQFVDHDIDLTPTAEPPESFDVPVPKGDAWFDPFQTGTQWIELHRSLYQMHDGQREQVNVITAFIDGSSVYGSDEARARALRTLDGSGRLKTSEGSLLPFNEDGLPNAPDADPTLFLAGDERANEQVGLIAMHTLFVREHNFWADRIQRMAPRFDGDTVYQWARAIVVAEIQKITYRDFLPVLLGRNALRPYRGYRPYRNPGIANEFSTAAYRFGHSMLSPVILRLDRDGDPIDAGHLSLADAFFHPEVMVQEGGIDPILRGMSRQTAQNVDMYVVDAVRNFLFGPPGSGGLDLASLNLQRGRDHGLPGYNRIREAYGLRPARSFADITPDREAQRQLAELYQDVDTVDAWVGMLAEPHVGRGLLGETCRTVVADQFERLRDGDRYYYRYYLPRMMVRLIERQTLSRIIRRNTGIGPELQRNVFRVPRSRRCR